MIINWGGREYWLNCPACVDSLLDISEEMYPGIRPPSRVFTNRPPRRDRYWNEPAL